MALFRVYLLTGLILHKFVWEMLKRRPARVQATRRPEPFKRATLVKIFKVAILVGILLQTFAPAILPIVEDPFFLRVGGGLLYTAGLLLAIWSRIQLGNNWSDIETAQVLRDQNVVSHGIYRYVRHPIYVGDLALLFGLELSLNSWLMLAVAAMAPIVLRQAIQEEKMLLKNLPGYAAYCQTTKRFIPFIV